MKRIASFLVVSTFVLAVAPLVRADVKTQHKSTFQLGGMLGGLLNRFAGDAAKDGLVSTTAVKGSRQLRGTAQTGKIIDLAEEKVYTLDMKRKEYRVTTFAELRKQWQDAQAKAEKDVKDAKSEQPTSDPKQSGKQYEISASVKETGQSKSIAGHTAREVVLTITVHEKGKTLEAGGGLMGRLANKMAPKPKAAEARSKVFTATDEVLSIETTVTAEDTAIPAGFKEKK